MFSKYNIYLPMNIIQTWKNRDIPPHYRLFINKVKMLNPSHNYMFFTDTDIEEFIEIKMPEYKEAFYGLTEKIQQIDFFRYLAIYYYGGLYLDLDMDLYVPFDGLLGVTSEENPMQCIFPVEQKNISDLLLINQNTNILIGNYAFYATKQHPFIKQIIDNIVSQRIAENEIQIAQSTCTDDTRDVFVYYRTGPILVTQSYIDYNKNANNTCCAVTLLEPTEYKDNCFGNYGFHRCYGSWRHSNPSAEQTPIAY